MSTVLAKCRKSRMPWADIFQSLKQWIKKKKKLYFKIKFAGIRYGKIIIILLNVMYDN